MVLTRPLSSFVGTADGHKLDGFMRDLDAIPFLGGILHEDITLTAAKTLKLKHGLNHKLRGWYIVRLDSKLTEAIHEDRSGNPDTGTELWLVNNDASTTAKISIWVF